MLNTDKSLNSFINDIRTQDDHEDPRLIGRPALLAGRAVVDVGREHFRKVIVKDVRDDLCRQMQDIDHETGEPARKRACQSI